MQLLLTYEIGTCADCGRPVFFGEDHSDTEDGTPLCAECRDNGSWRKCAECGAWCLEGNMTCVGRSEYVCDSCLDENFVKCHDCGDWIRSDDAIEIGDEYFCDSCADDWTVCYDCDELINTRTESCETTHDGRTICESCYNEDYYRCENCDEVFHCYEGSWADDGDYWYCDECGRQHAGVESYHAHGDNGSCSFKDFYRPRLAEKDKSNPLLFGVELESDKGIFDVDAFSRWTEDGNLVHFEHDGSLSKSGVELITMPCSLLFHQTEMDWPKICGKLISQGFKSHNTETCGLHVHVGREGLNPSTISKMDFFVNHAKEFFGQIARRRHVYGYNAEWDERKLISSEKGKCVSEKRYQPVNTSNKSTVEIRIFRGTLKWNTLVGSIEMVHAMITFLDGFSVCELVKSPIESSVMKFVDWCGAHADEYPQLVPMFMRLVKDSAWRPNVVRHFMKIERKKQKENETCA